MNDSEETKSIDVKGWKLYLGFSLHNKKHTFL